MKNKIHFLLFVLAILTVSNTSNAQWVEHPSNPLLLSDTQADGLLGDVSVIKDGAEYVMYYGASKGDFSEPFMVQIFRATSPDGVIWTRNSLPVLSPGPVGSWDSLRVETPSVTKLPSGIYLLYFAGSADTAVGVTASHTEHLEV